MDWYFCSSSGFAYLVRLDDLVSIYFHFDLRAHIDFIEEDQLISTLSHGVQDLVFVHSLAQTVNDECSEGWRFARPGFVFSQSHTDVGHVHFKQAVDEALALPFAQYINVAVANFGKLLENKCIMRHAIFFPFI